MPSLFRRCVPTLFPEADYLPQAVRFFKVAILLSVVVFGDAKFSLPPSGEVAKWSVSEILTIGDRKRNAKRCSDLLSPSAKSSRKVARFATFTEGDGKNV